MKLLLVSLFLLFEFARLGHSQIFLLDEVEPSSKEYDDLIVKTSNGYVRGVSYVTKEALVEYRMFNGWLGIPYAKPPIGPLRFKWPEPVESWFGIKQTSTFPPVCYQIDPVSGEPTGSEDCLFLNVYAPPKSKNLAVMVYIHPSDWTSGSPRTFDPAALAIKTNVVIVSVQYRHNVFGYLYQNGTDEAPGNQAFGDQILALKWVKQNIAAFGGDPTRVTLFGSNSGASSIGYHLVSPLSANLFTGVILQSGSAFTPNQPKDWQSASDAYTDLMYNLGCNECTTEERLECARAIDARELLGIASLDKQPYGPVVDGYFLPYEPRIAYLRGEFQRVPVLIGSNHDEANTFFYETIPEYRNTTAKPDITFSSFRFYLRAIFTALFDGVNLSPSEEAAVYFQYSNWINRNDKNVNYENLNNAFSDYLIRCPTVGMANLISYYKQDVFYYSFTHVSSKSKWPVWFGAVNGAEKEFVSGLALYKARQYTSDERDLANQMIKYWSNFAKYGNPNGKLNNEKPTVEWPPYILRFTEDTIDQREYLNLNGQQIQLGLNFKAEQCGFWLNLIPKLKLFSALGEAEDNEEELANFY